ncbi:methionyl-tRNA formyltransferase [Moorena producens PAL-8-15-08-1]|uniref:Methionyl-tRNA formyltransferase n=1 Tax=Moorena producens PAL-8-15-08-1 TaxID=1458985 RepID=A0A1D8TKP2_9CYAN|nr:methionyl-tRNA formyltransferase [Moorena producens]AOW98207.1 methionyl-tRNA formyltransferase [Moorena producens PAL-8-15-08-1]
MRVVFFGTPQFALPCLEGLLNHPEFEVVGVVTQPDKRRGRGNQLIPSPVKSIALAHKLPVWQPQRLKKHRETLTQLRQVKADVFVVVAYGQILSQEILDMPTVGCINVHGSILPKYRGAAPIQWCLYNGEAQTGITTMLMDAGMDTGAMLLKAYTPIRLLDTAQDLAQTLSNLGADLLIETLLKQELQEIQAIPQDHSEATYAPLIQKSDYGLDWSRSNLELHNQIRGFFPNCVTSFRGKSLKISATAPLDSAYLSELPSQEWSTLDVGSGRPGEVVKIAKGIGPIIKTGNGLLLLQQVQLAGKRAQSAWDFANGMRLEVGEVLGNS